MRLTRLGFVTLLCGSAAALAVGPGAASSAATTPGNCTGKVRVICTFSYNGANGSDGSARTWRVPAGVRSARFDLYGAEGGGSADVSAGGRGGETSATVSLTTGSVVTLLVGGRGTFNGGFNGGGAGSQNHNPGFGGGGGGFDYKSNGAGGGGSSYVSPNKSRVRNAMTKAGVRAGNGLIVITYIRPS
jgi:hypothetical protein